ncbi:MAG: N-acetylmuramoyl-L-alanine amidase [Desulfobacterales bacterium]
MINKKNLIRSGFTACIVLLFLSSVAAAEPAKNKYMKAEAAYNNLLKNSKKQKYRSNWIACIKKYQGVYNSDPTGPWAAAGKYKTGMLYYGLYKWSNKKSDKEEALNIYKSIIQNHPKSAYRPKALEEIRRIAPEKAAEAAQVSTYYKKRTPDLIGKKDPAATVEKIREIKTAASRPSSWVTTVTDIRYWSNPNYTRIVIDADSETTYTHRLLKKDPAIKKPQRLYIDLDRSRLGKAFEKIIPINDNLLKNARAGQYSAETVRVVIDIKSFKNYKVFSLKNPFRIVIDVWGEAGSSAAHAEKTPQKDAYVSKNGKKIPPSAIAKQLSLCVRRIVIDPGHGGHDYGAPGYIRGAHEKYIVLSIAKKLASKIRKTLHCEVVLTRTEDRFLTLEERTAIANTQNADLFISLHTNASRDRRAYGIETYFLNLATDDDAIRVAAWENATSTKNISDLQSILLDLMQNAKINESSRLATYVQDSMYTTMKKSYGQIKSKGVKQAPFYVLLGAQMPAILIETAFISNPRECKRLMDSAYQERLCDSIVHGIKYYIQETNPTAFMEKKIQ